MTFLLGSLRFLRRIPWQAWAAVAVVAVGWWQIHAYGNRRADAATAAVEARWQAQVEAATDVARKAESDRIASEAATEARNREVSREYAQKLAAADRDRSRLERLLRNALAQAAAGSGGDPPPASLAGAAPAGPQGSDGPPEPAAGVAGAIADALTEARANAAQLDSLIGEVRAQLGE